MTTATVTNRKLAPGPRGHFLMGNLKEYKLDPIRMLLRLRKEYGDIARNRLGPYITHAVAHPDYVRHVLQTNHGNYVRGRFYDNFKVFFGNGLLTTDGDFWLRHRRVAQPIFHRQHVQQSAAPIRDSISDMLGRWQHFADREEEIDVVPEMMRLSLSVLGKMMFDVDISQHAATVGPAVRFGLEAMMPQGNLNDFIPLWVPTPHTRRIRRAQRGLNTIIRQVIDQHRRAQHGTNDLITMLLSARGKRGEGMSAKEVHEEVMTVFLAGHETTGSGLAWALYALSQHPDVRRKLEGELDRTLGTRPPTVEDLPRLPYLRMVVDEALRVYPPIWGFTRDAAGDDQIGGYHIPAGSSIFVSPYVTHRHPDFWENPDAFDPERFTPERSSERPALAYLPFGAGPRQCIGLHMATLQIQLTIAMITQQFRLDTVSGQDIRYGALISLRPVNGIHMRIGRRSPSVDRETVPSVSSSMFTGSPSGPCPASGIQ